ncbi:GDSL-type esterase/lipase family protein [Mesorhizobium sp. M1163]|uniref:GDSL-type esterase/lipase family protein n=1 Tax=Mesorhizobium sp. M1163 TaxID=2957065 RepID=UPI00333AC227
MRKTSILVAGFLAGSAFGHWGYMPLKASIWPEAVSVPATTYQAARNSIFAARRSSGDAVMIGDSITEMGDWDAIFPDYRIINRGVYSDNTAGLLARTDELSRVDADIAFVMIGTNDFTIRLDANGTFGRYNRIIKALAPKR